MCIRMEFTLCTVFMESVITTPVHTEDNQGAQVPL